MVASHKEEISKMLLLPSIKKIDDNKIKDLATACAWIGNDETHYERRNPDKDLSDLKAFTIALIRFISAEISLKEAQALINKPK